MDLHFRVMCLMLDLYHWMCFLLFNYFFYGVDILVATIYVFKVKE